VVGIGRLKVAFELKDCEEAKLDDLRMVFDKVIHLDLDFLADYGLQDLRQQVGGAEFALNVPRPVVENIMSRINRLEYSLGELQEWREAWKQRSLSVESDTLR